MSDYTTKTVERGTALPIQASADANHTAADRFCGFSFAESAGSPAVATVVFRHGSATGDVLAILELGASGSETVALPFEVSSPLGVYVDVDAGTVTGVIYTRKD